MSQPHPHLGDYGEPPDGDYARYVERLLQGRDRQPAATPAATTAGQGAAVKAAAGKVAAFRVAARPQRQASRAAARAMRSKWPLVLWILFVLLMWFAPDLLPLGIGAAVVAAVGYSLWKARHGPQANDR